MNALEERKQFQIFDNNFKPTLFLEKHPTIKNLLIKLLYFLCKLVRKLYSGSKNNSKTIVIINIQRVGDTVFSVPAINQIYNSFEDYKIFIVCWEESKNILNLKFNQDDLIPISKTDFKISRKIANSEIRDKINSLNPEVVFDLSGQITSASMIFNSSAHTIIGTNIPFFKGLYDKYVEPRKTPHFIDVYLDVVRLVVPIPNTDELKSFQANFNLKSKVLIHPFAIRKAKEWNLNKFIKLAENLVKDYEVEIVCPPGFIEEDVMSEIELNGIPVSETQNIDQLIEKIKECSLFICNDSGPIYIASLLGKATFTVYGPSNSKYSIIPGKNHKFIRKELKCTPKTEKACFTLEGIYCPAYECMDLLSFEIVKNHVRNFISELNLITCKNKIH
jgi:ADP-heptose:LPS heptosyltransferase